MAVWKLRNTSARDLADKGITAERVEDMVSGDENAGACIACGAEADSVEPDARQYKCTSCGEFAVFGAEELLLVTTMG